MKIKSFLLFLFIFAGLLACKKDEEVAPPTEPATLGVVTSQVQLSLDTLNNALSLAGTSLATASADTAVIRIALKQIYEASSYAKELAYINQQGILQIIEPSAYYQYQGADLSKDTAVIEVLKSHQPYFTGYFNALEGYDAVADKHPAYNGTTSLGIIEALFTPYDLLHRIIAPQVVPPNEIWALEMNGVIIYEPDLTGIGRNVFTDPYFADLQSFKDACHTILQNESGETTYSYYQTGTTTVVNKRVWWKTIHLHNNMWKIVWAQPD